MGLVEKAYIISNISPPIDALLATQLMDEFVSMERRYIQRDWEPAELDGGHFSEVLARIVYHADSGNLNLGKDFDDCLRYVENDQVQHFLLPRHTALHIGRVLRTIYKFRSQRGAIHISPTYKPNHMDSKFLIESVRWSLNETLRVFWTGNKDEVAKAIREVLQFDVPCVGSFGEVLMVQRTDLNAEEEILVLLHYAGEAGFSRTDLGKHAMCAPSSVTRAVQKLESSLVRQIVCVSGKYRLTDLGSRRLREDLAEKLLLQ